MDDVKYGLKFNNPLEGMNKKLAELSIATELNRQTDSGYANVLYDRLMKQIADFEGNLKQDEEIGAYLASFGKDVLVRIKNVGYHNPYFIVFYGHLESTGEFAQLVQHVSQINVLFVALKVKCSDQQARRIGFIKENEEE